MKILKKIAENRMKQMAIGLIPIKLTLFQRIELNWIDDFLMTQGVRAWTRTWAWRWPTSRRAWSSTARSGWSSTRRTRPTWSSTTPRCARTSTSTSARDPPSKSKVKKSLTITWNKLKSLKIPENLWKSL